MSFDGRTADRGRQGVSAAIREEDSGCARERRRKWNDQPQAL